MRRGVPRARRRSGRRETGDAGALAVARFYERRAEQLAAVAKQHPDGAFTGSEWIAFVHGDDAEPVHERPAVRAYWSARRRAEDAEGGAPVRCLVTGDVSAPARTHGSIKRVPEAQTSGATLVTFNAEAFTSHGLVQGDNAPVSRAAAEGYVTALNWLLQGTDERRFRFGVPLGSDSVMVFWTRDKNPFVEADFLDLLDPPLDPEQARRVAEAPFRGKLDATDLDATQFYAVTLGGNAARVVVRDWLETTVADLKRHLAAYFDALRIAGDGDQPLSIRVLLKSVESPGGRGLSPDLGARLLRAALQGDPFPREFLGAALRRLRLPPDKLDERRRLLARCALVKATLMRPSFGARKEVSVSLDESSTKVPYLLGRLFAVLERLQGAAQGDISATIRDRWFGAASSTPAIVFPRLLRLSMHHAAKADSGGWYEMQKTRIIAALPAEGYPSTLSIEDQGLFAIGYYHQRQKFFEKRAVETPSADAAEPATA